MDIRLAADRLVRQIKVTAIFKDAVRTVYEDIGGHAAFADWAKEHPTDFYKIAARLIPTETASKEDTNLHHVFQTEIRSEQNAL